MGITAKALRTACCFCLILQHRCLFSVKSCNWETVLFFLPAAPVIPKLDKYKDAITILAGKSTIIEVPFSGAPQPSVTWHFNGGRLPDANRTTVETIYNYTTLTINRARLSDAGKYSLTLDNKHGKVTLEVKVKVLGEFLSRH